MKLPRCLWLLFLAASGLVAQTAQTAQTAQASFGIGTWNLEFLGADPALRRDTPPRTDDDLVAIGKQIAGLGVAVLAVQEINGEAPLQQVAAAAGPHWRLLLGTSGDWDDGKTAQHIGFVYDDSVLELLHAEELLTLPREMDGVPIFHRVPVTACFRHRATGCDFRLVTVHLKAGRKTQDEQKRRLEATLLRQRLQQLRGDVREDGDVFVLGDFNSGYDQEPERLLADGGNFVDEHGAVKVASIVHFDDTIDHILAASACQEADSNSFAVHTVTGTAERLAWRKTYSDHFPVTILLRANRDDDPDSTFAVGPSTEQLPVTLRPNGLTTSTLPSPPTTPPWPPAPGAAVRVLTDHEVFEGKLLVAVPDGPGGWVVLEANGAVVALPVARVRAVYLR